MPAAAARQMAYHDLPIELVYMILAYLPQRRLIAKSFGSRKSLDARRTLQETLDTTDEDECPEPHWAIFPLAERICAAMHVCHAWRQYMQDQEGYVLVPGCGGWISYWHDMFLCTAPNVIPWVPYDLLDDVPFHTRKIRHLALPDIRAALWIDPDRRKPHFKAQPGCAWGKWLPSLESITVLHSFYCKPVPQLYRESTQKVTEQLGMPEEAPYVSGDFFLESLSEKNTITGEERRQFLPGLYDRDDQHLFPWETPPGTIPSELIRWSEPLEGFSSRYVWREDKHFYSQSSVWSLIQWGKITDRIRDTVVRASTSKPNITIQHYFMLPRSWQTLPAMRETSTGKGIRPMNALCLLQIHGQLSHQKQQLELAQARVLMEQRLRQRWQVTSEREGVRVKREANDDVPMNKLDSSGARAIAVVDSTTLAKRSRRG
jgi:hypothetical protein